MNGENERIKRIEEFLLDPERALFTTLEEFRTLIAEILPVISKIDFATLETLKGEDGKTPRRGVDYMTQADIDALEAFILSKMPRADVDFASIEATEAFIKSEIAKIPRVKGDKGDPGTPGRPGKDGSPDSGADILRKLRDLGKNQGLQIKDIRGLENRIKLYNTAVDELAALKQAFEDQRVVIPANTSGGGSTPSGTEWGSITGTLSDQTDLQNALDAKQTTLVSGTNIKTINGTSLLGSGDIVIGGSVAWGAITGTLSDQTDLQTALNAKASTATTISAGTGLTGGGSLAANRTISLDSASIASLALADTALQDITGLVTQGTNVTITGTGTSGDPYVVNASSTDISGKADTNLGNLASVAINADLDPASDNAVSLGDGTHAFSDLFLGSGAVINFANGNAVLTHSSGILTVSTGDLRVTTAGTDATSVVTVGGTQTLTDKTLTSPVINVGSDAEGDLYYRNSSGDFTRLPIGTDGQVLSTDGDIPVWDDFSGGPTALTMFAKPEVNISGGTAVQMNTNTTAMVGVVNVTGTISPNVIFIRKTAIGSAGNFKVALFTTDGQTKIFEETFASGSSTGVGLYQFSSSVTIPAGKYYIMVVPVSSTDFSANFGTTQGIGGTTGSDSLYSDGGSAYAYEGTLTVTAGTIPTTFDPALITPTNNRTLLVRLDTLTSFIYTTSGTWVCPAGVTSVLIRCWGGGGGGGGGNGQVGGGGGGGAYAEKVIAVTPGNSYTVNVGTGGAGNGVSSNTGSAGGDSYFIDATTVMAKGGLGGKNDAAFCKGGLASASVGDTKYSGGDGTQGDNGGGGGGAGTTAAGSNASGSTGGTGGSLFGGRGGNGGAAGFDGQNGSVRGGGGGGGQSGAGAGASSGARGEVQIIPQ